MGEGQNLRRSSKVLTKSSHLRFLCLLCWFALLRLVVMASVGARVEGHLGFNKKSIGSGSEESGMPFGTSSWFTQMLCLNIQHP